ncbi:MAG: carbamoyltransferase HypF [Verrucomicrobia bacterium]|nr:carbamoyltransferase HypF [Verrucomicrobiota bacterium]
MKASETNRPIQRLRLVIRGAVQGIGFRPFVHRLATRLVLDGWVNNSAQGVFIEVEGPRHDLEQFLLRLEADRPPRSSIQSLESSWLDPVGYEQFEIRPSETGGDKTALVLPDIATCPDCLREIFDSKNRRHRYPFTNCTNCGPRFSIIESLPYDRANTSMKSFAMCPQCQAEYDDPRDRRFHAQPNACPVCGPQLEFWRSRARESADGRVGTADPRSHERGYDALLAAVAAIRSGQIVAVKGIGGFHLMVDARNDEAVRRLRERKHREEKPLALMFPSLETVKAVCEVSPLEERLLRSPEAPIVLLRRIFPTDEKCQRMINSEIKSVGTFHPLANSVAPGNPTLGVMLPSNPLHHLLMAELGFPVVATSGNLSDEPICKDEREALERLRDIADVFLVHDRPVVRHVDDSIVRVMLDREMVLRRARGYAPLPIMVGTRSTASQTGNNGDAVERVPTVLAVGAHLKNAVALAVGEQVFISQHIGDLETEQAHAAFRRVIADFQRLYEVKPDVVVSDLHPDYLSTKFALEFTLQRVELRKSSAKLKLELQPRHLGVQHHIAHVLSCMAENELEPPVLGLSWDGTGYGTDGTIWGGELFLVAETGVERVAHLRPFRLPGGDAAVKEPRRAALGLLHECFGDSVFQDKDLPTLKAFSTSELATLKAMLVGGLNSPLTSSVGRLFDAVASLTDLRQRMRFEGQAAMELEFALDGVVADEAYPLPIADCRLPIENKSEIRNPKSEIILEWSPMIKAILGDVERGVSIGEISAKFHNALAEAIVAVARQVGQSRVVLSGGCFQNRYLTERTVTRLRAEGFQPYWHQRVPPNDGGIALGQIIASRRRLG